MTSLENLTIKEIKEIQSLFNQTPTSSTAYEIGKSYLIRTVTFFYTGKLEAIHVNELVLSNAAWVAHTGRFNEALKTGTLQSVEPIPGKLIISRMAIVDATEWAHKLPELVK